MTRPPPPVALIDALDEVASAAWSWGREALSLKISSRHDLISALARARQEGSTLALVQGDDAFLARVLAERERQGASEVQLAPLPVTEERSRVAQALDPKSSLKRRARALLKAHERGQLKTSYLDTLKLSNSAHEAPEYGFTFAAGLFYDLWLARHQGGLVGAARLGRLGAEAWRSATSQEEQEDERSWSVAVMARDRQRVGPMARGLLCGALQRAPFQIALSEAGGARLLTVESEAQILALIARARAPVSLLRGEAGERFEVLHLDRLERYVFDGVDVQLERDAIVQITPGPRVALIA